MNILWIGGWGIPPCWGLATVEAFFPGEKHVWKVPSPRALKDWQAFDLFLGYSLGANLILRAGLGSQASLLAPFLDFKEEAGLGGRISLTQLRYVRRWLRRDPVGALNDFFDRAGLSIQLSDLPYSDEDLHWGLDILTADWEAAEVGESQVVLGKVDPLLNATSVAEFFTDATVLEEVGHDLNGLLQGVCVRKET